MRPAARPWDQRFVGVAGCTGGVTGCVAGAVGGTAGCAVEAGCDVALGHGASFFGAGFVVGAAEGAPDADGAALGSALALEPGAAATLTEGAGGLSADFSAGGQTGPAATDAEDAPDRSPCVAGATTRPRATPTANAVATASTTVFRPTPEDSLFGSFAGRAWGMSLSDDIGARPSGIDARASTEMLGKLDLGSGMLARGSGTLARGSTPGRLGWGGRASFTTTFGASPVSGIDARGFPSMCAAGP